MWGKREFGEEAQSDRLPIGFGEGADGPPDGVRPFGTDGRPEGILATGKLERSGRGVRVWREPLVWVAAEKLALRGSEPLPLVVSPPPCVYRKRATDSLSRIRRPWRVAYSCASLAGQHAAVKAGLGVTVLPKDMVPPGLAVIERRAGLPDRAAARAVDCPDGRCPAARGLD